jgi:hypothetical protein
MTYTKHGLRVLVLCLAAAFSLLAVTAVAAQAASWDVGGSALASDTQGVTAAATSGSEFLLLVPAKELIIHCKKVVADSPGSVLNLDGSATADLLFSECTTLSKGVLQKNCDPGTILAGVKALQILHNGVDYLLFEPSLATGVFATITFGGLCSLPSPTNITGSIVAECLTSCQTSSTSFDIKQASTTLFPTDVLKYGTSEALLDGTALVGITGGGAFNGLN